ncbi:unnamed protein product, partial [Oppiella nova]
MVAPMSKRRCGVGCAVLSDLLYAVGGHDGQSYLNSIERYDPHTNQWCGDVAPTSSCRTSVGVAVLDGFLYAVGGQDGVSCLNFVERYDPQTNRWNKVAGMSTKRLGVAVAVLGGHLYAIGGSDGTSPLNTVERYDPRTNRWCPVSPMGTRRKHLGCAVYNNMIYAVGGRDDTTELSSAERYNPQSNQWQPIVAMTSRRSGVGLAVVNGLLYAVGGFDGSTYLKTIEVYDPEKNQWCLCGSMNYRRLGGGVGVVRIPHLETELVVKKANPIADPLVEKRNERRREDNADAKRLKRLEDSEVSEEQLADTLNDKIASLWRMSYSQQLTEKYHLLKTCLLSLNRELTKIVTQSGEECSSLGVWLTRVTQEYDNKCCPLEDIRVSTLINGYRNKCEFTVGIDKTVGFRLGLYREGTVRVIAPPINCPIISDHMRSAMNAVQTYITTKSRLNGFDPETHSGHWIQATVRTASTGSMIILVLNPQQLTAEEITQEKADILHFF